MAVTRDATSGKWIPQSAAEFTQLLSGTGISNPSLLWMPGTPAAGNVADQIGTFTGTVNTSAGNYQQPVTGWSTKALVLSDSSAHKVVNQDAGLPDISTTAMLAFMWASYNAAPSAERSVLTFGPTFGTQAAHDIWASTPNHFAYAFSGGSSGGGGVQSTATATGVHPIILQIDRAGTALALVQTEAETLSHATISETGKSIALGGDNVSWWFAGGVAYIQVAAWFGAAAQLNATQRSTLIDRFTNGPAVTSVSVAPATAAISAASTVQLTATATRADGTTFDCTATAVWSSGSPSIALVSATGLVTGLAGGLASITATYTSLNATPALGSSAVTVTAATNWPFSNRLPEFRTSIQRAGFVEVVLTATPATAEWTALNLEVFGRPGRAPSRNRS